MRSLILISIFTLFMLAMDLYAMRGIQHITSFNPAAQRVFFLVYWGLSVLMLAALIWAGSQFQQMRDPSRFFSMSLVIGIFLMLYIPKLLFNVTQLLGDLTMLLTRLFNGNAESLRKYFLLTGAAGGVFLLLAFGMGMIRGRTNVKVFRETIKLAELPESFKGLKIVQLSDMHLAGFYNQTGYIRHIVSLVNELNPDLILFTGDMVHNFSEEVDPFTEILGKLEAPLGKYAVLGNHDYGHYFDWKSDAEEAANLERVKQQIRVAGFDLLLNEYRTISVNGDSLEIIGIENWGKPPFPQLGDLSRSMVGSGPGLVKILMSHDPSHWDLQVRGKENIPLTLSGHTHGMQLGIEIGKFKWSPSKWVYKNWAGHYQENGQHLYVNRGLGYTGFPGRVGIRPEITLLTLDNV